MKNLICLLAMLASLSIAAQSIKVNGQVLDENNQPLELANVLVQTAADSSMVTYGFTDADGNFRFSLKAGEKYLLNVSYLGYQSKYMPFTAVAGKALRLQLEPDVEALQEVNVTEEMPIVISGDTISYKADAFTTGEEKKLEDVLKRLPGVEIDDDGQVKVEGKTVEKVMVEGKDFFDGDSKIATKNIPADAVDKVQVLRNYEEIQPLAGLSSDDRVALNIKLKEGKKNLWFGDYEAKIGHPERYLAHANGFYYTPKASFNIIGDINNIGKPAFTARDYFRFSGGFKNLASRSGSNFRFAMDDIGIPLGQNNRTENMVSRFAATNFNYSPSKSLTISGFFIANENTISSPYTTERTYIGLDSLNATEQLRADNYSHPQTLLAKVSALYTPNKALHINYDAFAKLSNMQESTRLLSDFGDFQNSINTETDQQPYELKQELALYLDKGKSVYSIELQHLLKQQNPRFIMQSNQLPFRGIFPFTDSSLYRLNQMKVINSQQFQGTAKYYLVLNDKNHMEFSLGTSINSQRFESDIDEGNASQSNDFNLPELNNKVDFELGDYYAGLHYKTKIGKFTFRPGANFHHYNIWNRQEGELERNDYQLVLPEAMIRYDFKKSENLILRYNMQAQFYDVNQVVNGLLIQGYNSLFTGSQELQNATFHSVNLGYFNYDMFNFTTIFGGITYSRTLDGITNAVNYFGLERVFTPINSPGFNENLTSYASWSRKFEWVKTDARINASYNNTLNEVNGRENNNESINQNYSAGISSNFEEWPNIELNYAFTINEYLGANAKSTFTNHRPSIEITARFLSDFVFRSEYSYNNYGNTGSDVRTSFDFWDASVEYQQVDSPWFFSIEMLNILDTRFIREDGLSDNLITTTAYTVLPRYLLLGIRYDL